MTLAGYWPLDEDSGDTAVDYSGNNNDGTINDGGDSTVPGAIGPLSQSAYQFDGSNDYVDIGDKPSLNISGSQTISVWVHLNAVQDSEWNIVAGKAESGNEQADIRTDNNNGSLIFLVRDSGGNYHTADTNINTTGQWIHVVGVFDSSSQEIRIYSDGSLKSTTNIGDSSLNQNNSPFQIGARAYDSGSESYFAGSISEVRIYNHALTQQEVHYLYQVGKRGLHTSSNRTL